jgi:hypothetical protein
LAASSHALQPVSLVKDAEGAAARPAEGRSLTRLDGCNTAAHLLRERVARSAG